MHEILLPAGWILFAGMLMWSVPALLWFLGRELSPCEADACDLDERTFVSIIVPACNEAQGIQAALTSLLQTQGIRFEVIAVNDRSTDGTGDIMDRVAAQDDHLQVVHIEELPEGWLGKNHAMHVAANRALERQRDSDCHYLLFTDGDVVYEPRAVMSAVQRMQSRQLQHLCLLPHMLPGSMLENSVVAFFGLTVAIGQQVHLMPTRWPLSYAGVGAFNLVTRSIYETFDGHQKIAMDVLDDMKLGKLVRQHRGRQDMLAAPRLLSLRWYDNLWSVVTGLEKNGFAALDYSIFRLLIVTVIFLVTMISPYVVSAFGSWPQSGGFVATLVLWHLMFAAVILKFSSGSLKVVCRGLLTSLLFPVAALLMSFAFYRSAWITIRQGGVRWRTSFYDLQTLKDRLYQ